MSSGAVEDGAVEVAENWEDDQECALQQVEEKMKQVKILKRTEDDRKALAERTQREDEIRMQREKEDRERLAAMGLRASPDECDAPPVQIKLLKRPTSGNRLDQMRSEQRKPLKTLEERQAEYDAARTRILGDNYKPEATPTSPVAQAAPSRSKSPEQIRIPRFASPGGTAHPHPPPLMSLPTMAPGFSGPAHPSGQPFMMPIPGHSQIPLMQAHHTFIAQSAFGGPAVRGFGNKAVIPPSPPQEFTTRPEEFAANQMCAQPLLFFDASRPPPNIMPPGAHLPTGAGSRPATLFYTGPPPPNVAEALQPFTSTMMYSDALNVSMGQSRPSNNSTSGQKKKGRKVNSRNEKTQRAH